MIVCAIAISVRRRVGLARLQAIALRGKWLSEEHKTRIERKPKLENFLKNLKEFGEEINNFEDEILLEIYGKSTSESQKYSLEIDEKENILQKFLLELLNLQYQKPNEIKLSFFSENRTAMFRLMNLYHSCFKEFNCEIKKLLIFTSNKQPDQRAEKKLLFDREVWRKEIVEIDKFFNNPPKEIVGILMQIEGNLALPRFVTETGIHRFVNGIKGDRILINSTESTFEKFELSDDLAKRDSVKLQFERRIYDSGQNQIKDLILNKTFSLENVDLQEVFLQANKENLNRIAENLIS